MNAKAFLRRLDPVGPCEDAPRPRRGAAIMSPFPICEHLVSRPGGTRLTLGEQDLSRRGDSGLNAPPRRARRPPAWTVRMVWPSQLPSASLIGGFKKRIRRRAADRSRPRPDIELASSPSLSASKEAAKAPPSAIISRKIKPTVSSDTRLHRSGRVWPANQSGDRPAPHLS